MERTVYPKNKYEKGINIHDVTVPIDPKKS